MAKCNVIQSKWRYLEIIKNSGEVGRFPNRTHGSPLFQFKNSHTWTCFQIKSTLISCLHYPYKTLDQWTNEWQAELQIKCLIYPMTSSEVYSFLSKHWIISNRQIIPGYLWKVLCFSFSLGFWERKKDERGEAAAKKQQCGNYQAFEHH